MPDMKNLISRLVKKAPVILDGAWGTELRAIGLQPGECPDLWNISHPERVKLIASNYVAAGSKIILTNTFRANRLSLRSYGLEDKLKDINRMGVLISRKAASKHALVFGSIGPCGNLFMNNHINTNLLLDVYTEQADVLTEGGIDAILVETMTNLMEAKIALTAAKKTGLPVVVSFVFNFVKEKLVSIANESPESVAVALTEAGADVIGTNCGAGIENCIFITHKFRSVTKLPIWIKPSAGIPKIIHDELVYPTSIKNFSEYGLALSKLGVAFIGGCCGTTPENIRMLSKILKSRQKNNTS
ncbi:MAG: homocysteine S-methyltransferase family protein [Bacteroidota bacterium]|nr:homocysteine S-methyltransferase family protein [Bacteroidota bacterium]